MNLTRRNTIIGLGALAAGAGIIGGSGAFDAVEADRSFEVAVAGDAAGLLGLEVLNNFIAGTEAGGAGDNDIIFFRIDDDDDDEGPALNEDAETRFFEVFRIRNNGSQTVQVTIDTSDAVEGVSFVVAKENNDVDEDVDLESDGVGLSSGESVTVDIYIDTTDNGYEEPPADNPYQMRILAQSEEAQDQ